MMPNLKASLLPPSSTDQRFPKLRRRRRHCVAMSFFSKKAPPPAPVVTGPSPVVIDLTTIVSLAGVLALLGGAFAASIKVLPRNATIKTRVIFVWHFFDALIHFVFEGSFLWNCFFVTYNLPTSFSAASRNGPQITYFTPPDVFWLGRQDVLYGANFGTGPLSKLWQEYAKADKRWGGVDLTVVSLEILTVFVAGPLALWICYMLSKQEKTGTLKKWFWMVVLATGEIYGGKSFPNYCYYYKSFKRYGATRWRETILALLRQGTGPRSGSGPTCCSSIRLTRGSPLL